jgi:hypothetical protein
MPQHGSTEAPLPHTLQQLPYLFIKRSSVLPRLPFWVLLLRLLLFLTVTAEDQTQAFILAQQELYQVSISWL